MEAWDHSEAEKWMQEFGESKAGVKGIVDSGVTKIPKMFIHPPHALSQQTNKADDHDHLLQVPMIDFKGIDQSKARRSEVIVEIRKAAESWGFFQIVNHGVPYEAMHGVLESVGRFHEQGREAKVDWYSLDFKNKAFNYFSNADLNASTPAGWRDTISWQLPRLIGDDESHSHSELPHVCRREFVEYGRHMIQLQENLSSLMSEALGLETDYLSNLGCLKSTSLVGHYYPVCPQSHLTLGASKHSDISFLTLLLQDGVGGLQVLHRSNVWVDVPPVEGAIVANLGDLMQITSNGKFKSVEHRVLAPSIETPRTSVACFFGAEDQRKPYGPIKELVSETNPAIYRDNISFGEYVMYYRMKGQDGKSALPYFSVVH